MEWTRARQTGAMGMANGGSIGSGLGVNCQSASIDQDAAGGYRQRAGKRAGRGSPGDGNSVYFGARTPSQTD